MLCGWVPKEIPCPCPLFCPILSFEFINSPRLLLTPCPPTTHPSKPPSRDSAPKCESKDMREGVCDLEVKMIYDIYIKLTLWNMDLD